MPRHRRRPARDLVQRARLGRGGARAGRRRSAGRRPTCAAAATPARPGPYGLARHVEDAGGPMDAEGLDSAVVAGHSMGAYVVALMAVSHPERLESVVLVDGGPPLPVPDGADPDELLEATLGPSIERLSKEFADREAYHDFWREPPGVRRLRRDAKRTWWPTPTTTCAAAPPHLRSSVAEQAVRTDGRELIADRDVRTALETMRAARGAAACPAGAARPARCVHPGRHGRGVRPPHRGRCARCPTATTSRS